jgi:hypothetical protein
MLENSCLFSQARITGKNLRKENQVLSAFVRVGSTRITERIRLREGNEVARTAVLAYGRRVEQIFCDDSKSAVCIILVLWLR